MKLALFVAGTDGSTVTVTSRKEFANGEGIPIPEVGDSFFILPMDLPITIAKRLFSYDAQGDLEVILFPKNVDLTALK